MNQYRFVTRDGEQIGEHVAIAERVLGKRLPKGAVVHHHNKIKSDNRNENLVICQSSAYHLLIHARMRALERYGNANWIHCSICKKYDDPNNLYIWASGGRKAVHRACHAAKQATAWRGGRTDVKVIPKKGDGARYYARLAQKALGRPLPVGASVFKSAGLVICPSDAFRALLVARLKALDGCGNPDWCRCTYCQQWDATENMAGSNFERVSPRYYHRSCRNEWLQKKNGR